MREQQEQGRSPWSCPSIEQRPPVPAAPVTAAGGGRFGGPSFLSCRPMPPPQPASLAGARCPLDHGGGAAAA